MVNIFAAIIGLNIFAILIIIAGAGDGANFSFVNPFVIYKNVQVNWFGAIFLTIIVNLLFPIIATVYWFYKLCTIGRK